MNKSKINWGNRFKNKTVLLSLVAAVALFANQITQAFGVDYSAQVEQAVNVAGSIITLLVGLGIVVDPNTKGVADSGLAQTYTKPRDDKNPREYVQWVEDNKSSEKNNEEDLLVPERKEIEPEEFDISQPFSDDSDEVEYDVSEYEYDEELPRGASRFHDDSFLKDGKEDESHKEDFLENIDNVLLDDDENDNKVIEETVKEIKVIEEKDKKQTDK